MLTSHTNVNQETYKALLRDHLLPWATANLGQPETDWKLQEDNAPAHRARAVKEEKRHLGIRSIPWPSRSPDLNPIEHAWSLLGRLVHRRTTQLSSLSQLASALKEEWQRISQTELTNLINSMPRRISAVLKAKGGPTKY